MLKRLKSKKHGQGKVKKEEDKIIHFERTIQANQFEDIWVSVKEENDFSKLWRIYQIGSVSTDKKSVFVSDKHTKKIWEVEAKNTLSYDICHKEVHNDLTRLNYLHEASLLNCLENNYFSDEIYTWFGDTLISINPYNDIPNLYTKNLTQEQPHVFTVAIRKFNILQQTRKSQSIVINGDSGAGKTECAKQLMKKLVSLSKNKNFDNLENLENENFEKNEKTEKKNEKNLKIEEIILSSTPVLEAFGNSITKRNDNSSRFGRFIQIIYSDNCTEIIGMNTKHFLLEKSRIIQHSPGERNYHIFYQLCKVCPNGLNFKNYKFYNYLNPILDNNNYQSNLPNDEEQFNITIKNLTKIGINNKKQNEIWNLILGILSLGNINFIKDEIDLNNTNKCKLTNDSYEYLNTFISCLYKNNKNNENEENDEILNLLKFNLIKRTIEINNEKTIISLTTEQANDSKNALAKYLYSTLFDWLIKELNSHSNQHQQQQQQQQKSKKKNKFIGVLDIFGFEDLENNSFEQLCVNYTNELLQRQFDFHVISTERILFKEQGVNFPNIKLPSLISSEQVLNLLNNIIFKKLEEQCLLKTGTDKKFLSNLNLIKHNKIKVDWKNSNNFIIKHFAGNVSYQTNNFIEKNRDSLVEDLKITIYKTNNEILIQELELDFDKNKVGEKKKKKYNKMAGKSTVLNKFEKDMNNLISTLKETNETFIRCIKPNYSQNSKEWNVKLILSQLEYLGILQAIRVHEETYPVRRSFDFIPKKYFNFFNNKFNFKINYKNGKNDKEVMKLILKNALGDSSEFKLWQCGYNKVFLGNEVLYQLDSMVDTKRKEDLEAMSIDKREEELEKERKRQKKELQLVKLKLEKENDEILKEQKIIILKKEQKLKEEMELKLKQQLEEQEKLFELKLKEKELEFLKEKEIKLNEIEKQKLILKEKEEIKEKQLKIKENELELKHKKAEELILKQKEEIKKNKEKNSENLLIFKQNELLKLQQEQSKLEEKQQNNLLKQKQREDEYKLKLNEIRLNEKKLKLENENSKLKETMLRAQNKKLMNKTKKYEQADEERLKLKVEKRLKKLEKLKIRELNEEKKLKKQGAIKFQALVRGFLMKKSFVEFLRQSEHFLDILDVNERVIFSSIIFNEKPIVKGASKTKRRVMILTTSERLLIVDPISLKIEQKGKFDPKLCKSIASGEKGGIHIYLKSDWLATESYEWVVRDVINEATTWVAILSTMTNFITYIQQGFFKTLKGRATREEIIFPLKFGVLRMMDENGKYSAGRTNVKKKRKNKNFQGAYFVLCKQNYKHSLIYYETEKEELPSGPPITIGKRCKVLVPNEGSVNGNLNIFMFCLQIRKKTENLVSFESRGKVDRKQWVKTLKRIIRRDKFRKNDPIKVRKILKQKAKNKEKARNRKKSRKSNRITTNSYNSTTTKATNSLKLQVDQQSMRDSRTTSLKIQKDGQNMRDSRKSRKSQRFKRNQSVGRSTITSIKPTDVSGKSKSTMKSGRMSRKNTLGRGFSPFGKKKNTLRRKKSKRFNAGEFRTAFEEADTTSRANLRSMTKPED